MTAESDTVGADPAVFAHLLGRFAELVEAGAAARELTDWTLRQISALTGWPVAHVLLVDPHGAVTLWFSCRNNDTEWEAYVLAAEGLAMRTPTGLIDRVMATRRPGWVRDIDSEADYPRALAARRAGLRGVFALPVIRGNSVVAVLQFLSTTPIEPNQDFLEAMTIVGFLLGAAFDQVRLLGESVDRPSRIHRIVDAGDSAVLAIDDDGRITEWTPGGERLFGWTRAEAMYRRAAPLLDLPGESMTSEPAAGIAAGSGPAAGPGVAAAGERREAVLRRRDGSTFPAEIARWTVPQGSGPRHYLFCLDVSERHQRRAGISHDPLTGLLNRAGLTDRLAEYLAGSPASGRPPPMLLLVGLERFKEIDYSVDHRLADEAIQVIGARLTAFADAACRAAAGTGRTGLPGHGGLPEQGGSSSRSVPGGSGSATACSDSAGSPVVARIAGDEFAVVIDDADRAGGVARLAERAAEVIAEPFQVSGRRLALTASVGAAQPVSGSDVRSWLGDADAALYRSRHDAGSGPVKVETQARFEIEGLTGRRGVSWRRSLPSEMRAGLRDNQFEVYYQPIFALPDRTLTGAEALVRWHHPHHGLLLPGAFIDAAEDSGMIAPIGEWVLATAAEQLRAWSAPRLRVAVNLCARQLADPGIVTRVIEAVSAAGSATDGGLVVEMTESVLMADPAVAATRIGQFREMGVKVSIDDFGTGYSSMSYLKWFEVDILKIDMSFVHGLSTNRTDAVIVRTIIDLARELGMQVVAEGVETDEQLAALTAWGCSHVQGFGLARPAPAAAMEALIRSGKAPSITAAPSVR